MLDTAHLKLPYFAALQAQTCVTVSSEAAPAFSVGAAMLEHCRAPDTGGAR
jgi:hypothetical protein